MNKIIVWVATILMVALSDTCFAQNEEISDSDIAALNAKLSIVSIYEPEKVYGIIIEDSVKYAKVIEDSKDKSYSYFWRALAYLSVGRYQDALNDLNAAEANYNPKNAHTSLVPIYVEKANLYEYWKDYEKYDKYMDLACEQMLADEGVEYASDYQDVSKYYVYLYQSYKLRTAERYEESNEVLLKALALYNNDTEALTRMAYNMLSLGRYQDVLDVLSRIEEPVDDVDYYNLKADAYYYLGEYQKVIDVLLTMMCIKPNYLINNWLYDKLSKDFDYAIEQMQTRIKDDPDNKNLQLILGDLYFLTENDIEAIKSYNKGNSLFLERLYSRAYAYYHLGYYQQAINDYNEVLTKIQNDYSSFGVECLDYLARAYRAIGDIDKAIEIYNILGETFDSKEDYSSYQRGWCYEMKGEFDKAMAGYNRAISLDPNYAYYYLMRGELLHKGLIQGDKEQAKSDFETVLELDTIVYDYSCRQYALHYLGRDDEAIKWMDEMITQNPQNRGNYYDKACLYAIMGRKSEAVAALREAFEHGYINFGHIKIDDDMDPIRELPEFKALIAEYKALHDKQLNDLLEN